MFTVKQLCHRINAASNYRIIEMLLARSNYEGRGKLEAFDLRIKFISESPYYNGL